MLDIIKRKKENKCLEVLLKIFLIVGIIAGLCIIAKILYDKFIRNRFCYCDGDIYDFSDDDECCCGDDACDEDTFEGDIVGEADTAADSDAENGEN